MTFEEVIARTNPPEDCAEILRQLEELRRKATDAIVGPLEDLIRDGLVVTFLDEERKMMVELTERGWMEAQLVLRRTSGGGPKAGRGSGPSIRSFPRGNPG
jgi:hypothetical protein